MDLNRVESTTILKDASATAYGSRGANGVIVITTIRPKAGQIRINLNANYNVSIPDLRDYNLMNAAEKLEYCCHGWRTDRGARQGARDRFGFHLPRVACDAPGLIGRSSARHYRIFIDLCVLASRTPTWRKDRVITEHFHRQQISCSRTWGWNDAYSMPSAITLP